MKPHCNIFRGSFTSSGNILKDFFMLRNGSRNALSSSALLSSLHRLLSTLAKRSSFGNTSSTPSNTWDQLSLNWLSGPPLVQTSSRRPSSSSLTPSSLTPSSLTPSHQSSREELTVHLEKLQDSVMVWSTFPSRPSPLPSCLSLSPDLPVEYCQSHFRQSFWKELERPAHSR